MTKTYSIRFTGRRARAIGILSEFTVEVFAADPEAAKLALYDHYEHITQADIKEIVSPFDAEILVNHVQNTGDDHRHIRLYVERLREYIDAVARRHTKANADWHDDPESADHLLYHAPSDQQFPRDVRDKAILELVSRHLEVISENEAAAESEVRS